MLVRIDNINKSYQSRDGYVRKVLNNVSLSVTSTDFVTMIGPNGSGKTTFLNLIAGIDKPDSGTIQLNETNGNIGYVWQDYRSSLLLWLNVYDNIAFPLKLKGVERHQVQIIVDDLLKEFSISFSPQKEVYKLSGGQQQLVCLLRSIAAQPDVLLCDEPFSALDQSSRWTMAFYLEQLWLKRETPVLFVSHDIDESILLGNKIVLLNSRGEIEEILNNQLPRPRNIQMLNSPEHIGHRQRVIQFMKENGAIQDRISDGRSNVFAK